MQDNNRDKLFSVKRSYDSQLKRSLKCSLIKETLLLLHVYTQARYPESSSAFNRVLLKKKNRQKKKIQHLILTMPPCCLNVINPVNKSICFLQLEHLLPPSYAHFIKTKQKNNHGSTSLSHTLTAG